MNEPVAIDTLLPVKAPPASRRQRVWEEGEHHCHWCQQETFMTTDLVPDQATMDHVIARGNGGNDLDSNVVLACLACNRRRNIEDAFNLQDGSLLASMPHLGNERRGFAVYRGREGNSGTLSTKAYHPTREVAKFNAPEVVRVQRDQALNEISKLRKAYAELEVQLHAAQKALGAITVRRLVVLRLRRWTDALLGRLEGQ